MDNSCGMDGVREYMHDRRVLINAAMCTNDGVLFCINKADAQ